MKAILRQLEKNKVIAAVRDAGSIGQAASSGCQVIFLMDGDINNLKDCVSEVRKKGKKIFIHIDLVKGLAKDREGVRYIADFVKPDGIVTTKKNLISEIKKHELLAVLHFFLIDTQALETSIKSVNETKPDAVEIMPALMPRVIRQFKNAVELPIICAGLVQCEKEAQEAVLAGAAGVAAGFRPMWDMVIDGETIYEESRE